MVHCAIFSSLKHMALQPKIVLSIYSYCTACMVLLPTHVLPPWYTKLHVRSPVPVLRLSLVHCPFEKAAMCVCLFILYCDIFTFLVLFLNLNQPGLLGFHLSMNFCLSTLPSFCLALQIPTLNLGFPQMYKYIPLLWKILWFAKMNTYLNAKMLTLNSLC